MTEWIVPLLGLGAAEPAGLTESMPSRPQLEPMRENRFGTLARQVGGRHELAIDVELAAPGRSATLVQVGLTGGYS